MQCDFSCAHAIVGGALGRVFPAAQVVVRRAGQTLWSAAVGWLDPETQTQPVTADTLFDLASVTKLFVVATFMTLVEEGRVALDQPAATVLPEFTGARPIRPYEDPLKPGALVAVEWSAGDSPTPTDVDAGRVTFRHLLTHTSGLPAWQPLYRAGTTDENISSQQGPRELSLAEAARRAALTTCFSYPTGARIIYSDIGLILVGLAIERLMGLSLDAAVAQRVTGPLGLRATRYLRISETARSDVQDALRNTAPTEFCAWRGRRIVGEVHDENAAALDGVAGHAGLFSTATELAIFGETFLAHERMDESAQERMSEWTKQQAGLDAPRTTQYVPRLPFDASRPALLRPATIAEMIRVQAVDGATRRGLGFALWSPDPEASSNPFGEGAFGHTGFTGASLWMDPMRDLVVAVCTNRVYYGRDAAGILAFRVALHRAIVEAIG